MSTPVILTIQGRQSYVGQEPDVIRLDTEGTMEYRNGGWDITYEESELTGLAGVTTTFRVEPEKVTLIRAGKLSSTMVFQEGYNHDSLYRMEFGTLMISVRATRVYFDIVPDGGTIDLVYNIVIENTEAGVIDYHLDIRAKK